MSESTENLTLQVLKKIQNHLAEQDERTDAGFTNTQMLFAALNERLSGQLISEIELRDEMRQLNERLSRVEKRLELTD